MTSSLGTGFSQAEVRCADEATAMTEAGRQQARESDGEHVEWIYLRNAAGEWVARRTLRDGSADTTRTKRGLLRGFFAAVVDTFHPEDLFLR